MSSSTVLKPADLAKRSPRQHGNMVSEVSTLRFLNFLRNFLLFSMTCFVSFWYLFLHAYWIVLGSAFGAFGIKRSPTCHQTSMRKLTSKKVVSEEAWLPDATLAGARARDKGGVEPSSWGARVSE